MIGRKKVHLMLKTFFDMMSLVDVVYTDNDSDGVAMQLTSLISVQQLLIMANLYICCFSIFFLQKTMQ